MLSASGIRISIGKYLQFVNVYIYRYGSFKHPHSCVRGLHSVHGLEHKKFINPFNRKMDKSIKSNANMEKKEDPKVYMRDTIGSISNILRYSTWGSAQEQLEKLRIRWDSYTINQVLKTHPPMEKAWLFFNWASQLKGFKHDQFTYTTMLDIFGEARRISSMKFVFQQMQEKGIKIDAVTYTSLMHWLSKDGDLEGSLKMWEEMKANGCSPTVVSYTTFMKVLFDNNMAKEATDVYKKMLTSGCAPTCHTYTVLMEYLVGAGKVTAALEILTKMQEAGVQPDKATCNILIQRCSRAGETWAMARILQFMKENSIVLRRPVYLEALEAFKVAGESDELLKEVNPHLSFEGISDEEPSQWKSTANDAQMIMDRGIILTFLSKRNFIAIDHILDGLRYKNIRLDSKLLSHIIQAHCTNHRPNSALLAFKYGAKLVIDIERSAYLALVGFFIRSSSFSELTEIVEEMVRTGIFFGTYLVSLIIYKLGCTKKCDFAERIFQSLPNDQKNTATYTALMGAYFFSGDVQKGLEIFDIMRRNRSHSSFGTYRILIVGLEEAGRVCEAEAYKKEKKILDCREIKTVEKGICDLLFAGCAAC